MIEEEGNVVWVGADIIIEVFEKKEDVTLQEAIQNILSQEKLEHDACEINISQDLLPASEQSTQMDVARVSPIGKTCSLNDTYEGAPPCKSAEDVCSSKYVNDGYSSAMFIYDPSQSKKKFIYYDCIGCYEMTPTAIIDLNSIKFLE